MAYKPFGERLALDIDGNSIDKSLLKTNRGYTGHEHILEVDLIHMNGRIYDSTIGRFISADPNIFYPFDTQGFNRYSYVENNPLKYIDPSGFGLASSDDTGGYGGGYGSSGNESYGDTDDYGGDGELRDTPLSKSEKAKNAQRLDLENSQMKMAEAGVGGIFFSILRVLVRIVKPNKVGIKNSTKPKSRYNNYDVKVNKDQVENALRTKGFKEKNLKGGNLFTKDNHKVFTRDKAKSRPEPTADYTDPYGNVTKVRLTGE